MIVIIVKKKIYSPVNTNITKTFKGELILDIFTGQHKFLYYVLI